MSILKSDLRRMIAHLTEAQAAAHETSRQARAAEAAERLQRWKDYADQHSRPDLIHGLIEAWYGGDIEITHSNADQILLELIGDDTVSEIFNDMKRWYA